MSMGREAGINRPLHRSWSATFYIAICVAVFVTFELNRQILINYAPWSSATAYRDGPDDPAVELGLNGTVRLPPLHPPAAANPTGLRTLLYVTTHMSAHHATPLRICWPPAMRRSLILNSSDVVVHFVRNAPPTVAPDEENATAVERAANATRDWREHGLDAIRLLRRTFRHQNLTIHARPNPGYQEGAAAAVVDAARFGWWDGYDWVVRVNPDLIIRDERPLLRAMATGRGAANGTAGVFVNCLGDPTNKRSLVHTDFFAVMTSAVRGSPFLTRTARTAEDQFTKVVRDPVLNRGRAVWLEGSRPKSMVCRAAQGRAMGDAPVVHAHQRRENGTCLVPFD